MAIHTLLYNTLCAHVSVGLEHCVICQSSTSSSLYRLGCFKFFFFFKSPIMQGSLNVVCLLRHPVQCSCMSLLSCLKYVMKEAVGCKGQISIYNFPHGKQCKQCNNPKKRQNLPSEVRDQFEFNLGICGKSVCLYSLYCFIKHTLQYMDKSIGTHLNSGVSG